jgi:hypothetical protein
MATVQKTRRDPGAGNQQGDDTKRPVGIYGRLTADDDECRFPTEVLGLSYLYVASQPVMLAASLVCGATEAKALRAMIGKGKGKFSYDPEDDSGSSSIQCPRALVKIAPIGARKYHVVVVNADASLLLCGDDESLYQTLRTKYTTPIRREWMGVIRSKMEELGMIQSPYNIGHLDLRAISMDDKGLDAIVCDLVRNREVSL